MLVLIYTFIFSAELRVGIIGEKLGAINIVFAIAIIYIALKYINLFDYKYILLFLMISVYYIGNSYFYQGNLVIVIKAYLAFILPLLLVGLKINIYSFKSFFKNFLKLLNFLIVVITVLGIIDYLFNYKAINFISLIMGEDFRKAALAMQKDSVFRMFSLMGHPLFNAELYLMFYLLNNLYNKYIEKLFPNCLIIVTSMIGVVLTASKTGIVLIVACILFIYGKKKNILYYWLIIFAAVMTLKIGVFNNVIERFMSGSLTSGRSETWEIIKNSDMFPIKFFIGYGTGFAFEYNAIISSASAAFEYPIRMFSLELGIFTMMLIYTVILVYPVYKLVKRKHFNLLIAYLIVFVDVNTYNGLCLIRDFMLIFCIFIFTILNLSEYIYKNKMGVYKDKIIID